MDMFYKTILEGFIKPYIKIETVTFATVFHPLQIAEMQMSVKNHWIINKNQIGVFFASNAF